MQITEILADLREEMAHTQAVFLSLERLAGLRPKIPSRLWRHDPQAAHTPLTSGDPPGRLPLATYPLLAALFLAAGSALAQTSSTINLGVPTQSVTLSGGQDSSANLALGAVTVRGANQTGAGGASSNGGGALLGGGSNAATNTSSAGGTVEMSAGPSTGSTSTGLQGLNLVVGSYAQSGTVTQWDLECFTSTPKAVGNCTANPPSIAGVALSLSGTVQVSVAEAPSEVPINASSAVTIGHTVCAGSTASKVTDSGGTGQCGSGITVGVVIATSGTWPAFPDGTLFPTLSTTLPLVRVTTDGTTQAGAVNTLSVGSSGSGAGEIIWYDAASTGLTQSAPPAWTTGMSGNVLECQEASAYACTWAWVNPNALSSPSLGQAPSPITETFTSGALGVTQYTLVALDGSNPSKAVAATSSSAYGIAQTNQIAGNSVEVARYGTTYCVADTGGTMAGDLATIGTGTTVDCKDTGQTTASSLRRVP